MGQVMPQEWTEMAEEVSSRAPGDSGKEAPARRPYHPPVLRIHGSLARLTQGIGSKNGDGGPNRKP